MKYFLISIFLLVAFFLQVSFFQMPFVLIGLLILGIIFKEYWVFLAAFLLGILLDALTFRTIGVNSLFFTFMLGMVFLYERKFEIQSFFFVGFASFFSLLLYLLLFGVGFPFFQIILGVGISLVLFAVWYFLLPRSASTQKCLTSW